MARGINKVTLIGNVGADPQVRQMPNGKTVVNLRIATSETWKDKQTQEKKEVTEWHQVVLFDRLGDVAKDYLHKGSKIYIEGKLQTRKWTDKENVERYSTEIIGSELNLLDARASNTASSDHEVTDNSAQDSDDDISI